ncbi:hypothetical protein [Actinoplanes sp. NPDC026670]|uniref:hypothetical protein n=1 Tax=Actinoplanes sp. NPDC026670 TaxID=3154700 RepID=UPI0033C4EECB
MKNRRGDKHYEPRHGGTRTDNLRETAARAGSAVPIATGIVVSLVTGALFRDDVIRTAHRVLTDHPAHLVLAGWAFVAVLAGVAAGCLSAAARASSPATRVTLLTAAALTAPVVLWFLPTRQDKDPFPGGDSAFVTGGQTAWLAVLVAGFMIVFEVPRHLRIWGALAIAVVSIVSVITAAALAH